MKTMRWILGVAVLGLIFGTLPAGAQTIYKCETAQGAVYSQQPCARPGTNAQQKIELKPDHAPDPQDLARAAAADDQMNQQLRQNDLDREEMACINNQVEATRIGTRRRVEALNAQIREAEYSMGFSNNNLAGATRSQGLQERVASLRAAISTERQILAQTELTARQTCAMQRADAERAARSK